MRRSRERGKTRRLRSDHAAAGVRTEVVFETTIGPRHLRITRSPQQSRPKRHGDGFTTEQARILLEEEHGGQCRPGRRSMLMEQSKRRGYGRASLSSRANRVAPCRCQAVSHCQN